MKYGEWEDVRLLQGRTLTAFIVTGDEVHIRCADGTHWRLHYVPD